ncbi:hypothetical protein TRFO_29082 [Tritrichomonas foetus]|uniref:Uncharacterized protein n=1 Tax=Tritrichomonas foetus TaxID=1144522 RepID=A0A1J4JYH9_9EUKA|nr:hypothetical protein TRFO_29082 [Tritrichomonas foetus]|eukprot:OHT03528.1 hypothetical protein TRFO_29082 [Tritrichomonas foetus]
MAVPGIVRCYCGVGCAGCWLVISIWGFFFLGILALLFHLGKQGNIGHFSKEHSDADRAKLLMITWIIYIVLGILCGINLVYRLKHPFPEAEDPDAQKQDQFATPVTDEATPQTN